MEGCSKYCSYCVVPYTRGEEISRPLVDVLLEVAQLADQGVKEVTLLGQNVNAYRGRTPEGDEADFAMLLEYISEIDAIERIRYTTSHPREFTDRIIDCYRRLPEARQPRAPSGAGGLRPRARGDEARLHRARILSRSSGACAPRAPDRRRDRLHRGLPGETEADFEQTMKLQEEIGFDASFSFIYSPRPGTPAARLPDDTPYQVKLGACSALQAANDARAQREISRAMVGGRRARAGRGARAPRPKASSWRAPTTNRIVNFPGPKASSIRWSG